MDDMLFLPDHKDNRSLQDIAEFLAAVGVHHEGISALRQLYQNGLHGVFLRIRHNPVDGVDIALIHKKNKNMKDKLLLLLLLEKLR